MATEFATPPGRLVQGAVLELQKVLDDHGKQKLDPQTGQPVPDRVYLAVAIAKTPGVQAWWLEPPPRNADGSANNFWQDIYRAGMQGYPGHFNAQTGECTHPRFAWKIIDGDGKDQNGKPNSGKEGFAGCWVVKFGGQYLPKLIHNGAYIDNPKYVKRGYYVRVFGNATPNVGAQVPGLYLNPNGVEFLGYGPEITSGPDVLAVAAKYGVAALPPGASAVPLAGTATAGLPPAGGAPGMMPAPQGVPGAMPPPMQPQQAPQAMPGLPPVGGAPGMTPAPNHAFVQNAMQPQQAPTLPGLPPAGGLPTPPMQVAQPVYQMTAAAQGFTREQYLAQGYKDEQLIASGYMVRIS